MIGRFLSETNEVSKVVSKLQDDTSIDVFANRYLYSKTGNSCFLRGLNRTIPAGKEVDDFLNEHCNDKLIIFGAGQWGSWIREVYDNVNFFCYADNNSNKKENDNFSVIGINELVEKHRDAYIIVTPRFKWKEIRQQLLDVGFNESQIFLFGKRVSEIEDAIYFDLPYLPHLNQEIFCDVGGYNGDSTIAFQRWVGNSSYQVKVFEPNPISIKMCKDKLGSCPQVEIITKGLWSETTTLHFKQDSDISMVTDSEIGNMEIPVTSLDELMEDSDVSFIKMDIEGSEMRALEGAKKTIKKHKPKLAISIYHKPEDIIDIPLYILSLENDYKLYLRHYSFNWFATVLYAI